MGREDALRQALRVDGLALAEDVTGKSYKEDKDTEALGVFFHLTNGAEKRRLLENTGDTTILNTVDRYHRIIEGLGFYQVLDIPFLGRVYGEEEARPEHFYVFWEPSRGILLKFDTHNTVNVNGGKFYYNWRPTDPANKDNWRCTSSGRWCNYGTPEAVWSGDHDCREAVKFHIAELEANGSFVTPWTDAPHLWLIHYNETPERYDRNFDYGAITKARIAMLPADVQAALNIPTR